MNVVGSVNDSGRSATDTGPIVRANDGGRRGRRVRRERAHR